MLSSKKRSQDDLQQNSTHAIHAALNSSVSLENATGILQQIRVELSQADEAEALIQSINFVLAEETNNLELRINEKKEELASLESLNTLFEEKNRAIKGVIKIKK